MSRTRVLIMGAAGRDFHNFNTVFRDDPSSEVAAFTATQIPNIDGRRYPAARLPARGSPCTWRLERRMSLRAGAPG
jgi:predicted GTPase